MSNYYIPTTWVANQTVASADKLNNIENGIVEMHERVDDIRTEFDAVSKDVNDIVANVTNGSINATNNEIVLARKGETSLRTKIDKIDEQFNTKASKLEVDVERKRIDSLSKLAEGSTTGDAELIDARIGANGVTYDNVGENIRDISKGKGLVKKCLNRGNTNYYRVETNNIFNENNNIRIFNSKAWTNADGYFDDENLKTTESIDINVSTTDIIYTNALYINMLHDETYLSTINGYVGVTIPINVVENCNRLILIFPKDVTPVCKVGSNDYEKIYDDKLIIQEKNLETIPFISNKNIYKLYKNKLVDNVGDVYSPNFINISNVNIKDSCKTKFSNKSKRLVLTKNATPTNCYSVIEKTYSSFDNIGIWFYIDEITFNNLDVLTISLYNNDVYKCRTDIYKGLALRNGWNFINVHTSEFGYGIERDFNKIVLSFTPISNVGLNEKFGSIVIDSIFVNFKLKPLILINYDDIYEDADRLGLYDYHLNNNIPYTIFSRDWDKRLITSPTIVNKLLKNSSISDVELGIYGTYDDESGYDVMSGEDFIKTSENIKKNKNALMKIIGKEVVSYSCTHNKSSNTIKQGLLDNNIGISRDGRNFQTGFFDKDILFLSIYWDFNISVQGYKDYIDKAIQSGRIACIFTHNVTDSPTENDTLNTDWFEILEYIKSKNIEAITFEELYKRSIN